ncbi:heparan-alpha-glucosaminide N-acetyltransferase domain-containing protein [Pseudoalteromonas sp. MMG022]|uniref:DUF1624 domain-containing protein n=1 Tax=Pseudoalteromonas sp. MMG022 TaxID=2909978 RepID=UPI001F160A94|nr:heparan-alpha-glucosaminide N-acetyltransferase domain-containing protein [Pseudoalteromonas sp. MMG022]MCF6436845.1 heparan-alpha-glucosaminide N-acetyltransferase domain-containing protein [Pseudoalteromonas sp. MMG022]
MEQTTHNEPSSRLSSIDLLRGLIIILMALDHTRNYWGVTPFSPTDLEFSNWAWFFTRWITHFCAPLFVFLTGVSAFLYAQKVQDAKQLRHFLFTRGVWLIILEIALITPSWQVSYNTIVLQVIWVIGCSMVLLSLLINMSTKWILLLTLPFLLLHNAVNDTAIMGALGSFAWLWQMLHVQGAITLKSLGISTFIAYPLIPWFSIMALGYVVGQVYTWSPQTRIPYLTNLGLGLIMSFILLRATGIYGDPQNFVAQQNTITSILSFLNTHKYPPSLQYTLMTIGPGLILLAQLEKLNSNDNLYSYLSWLKVFGAVPLFFYVIHVPIINGAAHLYTWFKFGEPINMFFAFNKLPPNYAPSLWLTYCVWLLLLWALYYPCKHYANLKNRSSNPVLSYL